MLVAASKLIGTQVLSINAGGPISQVNSIIVDPNELKIVAFRLRGGVVSHSGPNLLPITAVREYSNYGIVINDVDDLAADDEIVRLSKILALNFALPGLKVESKKGSHIGKVIDYTADGDSFMVQQLIVKRPAFKSFMDPDLTIPRKEIVEVTDYKVIIKDEMRTLKEKESKENFVPNFVNPFREKVPGFTPSDFNETSKN